MDDLSCNICFNEFDAVHFIPKCLECGHSTCSSCLLKILETSKCCPKCRHEMAKTNISEFPTNYSTLNFSEVMKKHFNFKPYMASFESLKMSLKKCENTVTQQLAEKLRLKNMIEKDLSKIENIIESKGKDLTMLTTEKLSKELEDDLVQIEGALKNEISVSTDEQETINIETNISKPTISFALSEFQNKAQFVSEISIRLHKGEAVFATKSIDGKSKYGKIIKDDDYLLTYSLSLSSIEGFERPAVVKFDDLVGCSGVKDSPFIGFLEIADSDPSCPASRLLLKATADCILSQRFFERLSGERGASYKRCKLGKIVVDSVKCCCTGRYHRLENLMVNLPSEETDNVSIFYDMNGTVQNVKSSYNDGDILVSYSPNGSFKITRIVQGCPRCTPTYPYSNIVAKGLDSSPFVEDDSHSCIEDCGIACLIPHF